jgi:1,4-dihydroxy-2-naphthoate octaprenyltransferase
MARLAAWVQASRPLAQIPIFASLLYGEALAWATRGAFQWKQVGWTALFGLFAGLLVVFANDAVDVATDVTNTTHNRFSGSSRVVPERRIPPATLAGASIVAFFGMAATSVHFVFIDRRAWMVVLAAIAAHLFWIYSFPPFRLSYRGHGEFLQGAGMGLLLPMVGYYAQAATLEGLRPITLLPAFVLGYAANVTIGLADTPADQRAQKRTFSVRRGEFSARRASLVLIVAAALATPLAVPGSGFRAYFLPVLVAGLVVTRNARLVGRADADERALCAHFMLGNLAAIVGLFVAWSLASFAS